MIKRHMPSSDEEQKDLEDIKKVINEPTIPFEEVLKELKIEKDV